MAKQPRALERPPLPLTDSEIAANQQAAQNEQTLRDRADGALDQLDAAVAGWAGLTAAQKDGAIKLSVRVVATLARLVLRKLDKVGA